MPILRSSKAFRLYWIGQSVSAFGDQVSRIGIPLIAVVTLHAGAAQLGVLSSAAQVSTLVFGLAAGAWVDRVRRRQLLIGCDIARAAAIAVIPCAAALGGLSLPLLIALAFFGGSLGVLFGTASIAFLPSLVRPDELIEANARSTQSVATVAIAGPGLGGALIAALTAPFAIVADAISYLASAAFIVRLPEDEFPVEAAVRPSMRAAVRAGVKYVYRQELLRPSAACAGTYNFFNSAIVALQVLYLSRTLGLGPAAIGLVLGAIGPGALVGAAVATRVSGRLGVGRTMICGLAMAGFANVALASAFGAASALMPMGAMFLSGLGQPLYNINQGSLRQAIVPADMRGRVSATLSVVAGGAAPIGALVAGFCAQALGVRAALILAAAGTALSCVWLLRSPIRTLVRLPVAEAAVA